MELDLRKKQRIRTKDQLLMVLLAKELFFLVLWIGDFVPDKVFWEFLTILNQIPVVASFYPDWECMRCQRR